jgi:hypothetical protein
MAPVHVVVGATVRQHGAGVGPLKNSSRSRPLKLSIKAFWIAFPAAMREGRSKSAAFLDAIQAGALSASP